MVLRPGPASLSLLLLCACPGDPLEADSGTATGSSSSGADASATMTSNATLTASGGMSATIASDSNDSSGSPTDPSATSAATSDTQTSDPSETDATTTDATTTDATTTDATTTDATTETTAAEESTTTGGECVGDEAMLHQDPFTAIALAGLDCDDAAAVGAGVIDDATWEDWWSFYGSDAGSCEPDMVRVQVTSGTPLQVCAYLEIGCIATCSVGVSDGLGLGCCGDDQVVFSAACGNDDSSLVSIRFGDGSEQCQAFTFSYEF